MRADEAHLDPGLPLPGFANTAFGYASPGTKPPDVAEDVGVAVAVEVGEGHAVALLQVAGAAGRGGVDEAAAALVQKQELGMRAA